MLAAPPDRRPVPQVRLRLPIRQVLPELRRLASASEQFRLNEAFTARTGLAT